MIDKVAENLTFSKRIIICDKKCIYEHDVETPQQPSEQRTKISQNRKNQNSVKTLKATPARANNKCVENWIDWSVSTLVLAPEPILGR